MGNGISAVESARRRATASAFLQKNRGPQPVSAVAENLGVSVRSAGQILNGLSRSGLISPPMQIKGVGKGYAWKGGGNGSDTSAQAAPAAVRAPAAAKRTTVTNDVELVLSGVLVVIGRNAKTGRIRITLEDAAP